MSEAQTSQLEVHGEETIDPIEFDNLYVLRRLGWSPITQPSEVRYQRRDEISQLKRIPFAERIVPTAYCALRLAIESLKTPSKANDALNNSNSQWRNAKKIRDDYLIANAVNNELYDSQRRHINRTPPTNVGVITKAYTPRNVGCLLAVRQMREAQDPKVRIPFETGFAAETVLRGFIARWAGLEPQDPQPHIESVE